MINHILLGKILWAFEIAPICALLGPRQCGETTLAKLHAATLYSEEVYFFYLKNPVVLARLDNPKLAFDSLYDLSGYLQT
jgi:predicted AAA+ superfamily ATPase